MAKVYCEHCNEYVYYEVRTVPIDLMVSGINIKFEGEVAFCKECEEEVGVDELDDKLIATGNDIYIKKLKEIKK